MKRAAFIVSNDGNGHRVRCEALALELRKRGWSVVPWTACDVLIVDDPFLSDWEGTVPVVRIVDTPAVPGPIPDVLVCSSPGAQLVDFVGLSLRGVLIGPQYALLRSEFAEWRQHADAGVQGEGIEDARSWTGLTAGEIVSRLSRAELAITYGGVRALECACMGVPAVIVPRNDGEKLNARGLALAGAGVSCLPDDAESVADNLKQSPALLRHMSKQAMGLVDGLGCQRVAAAIQELV